MQSGSPFSLVRPSCTTFDLPACPAIPLLFTFLWLLLLRLLLSLLRFMPGLVSLEFSSPLPSPTSFFTFTFSSSLSFSVYPSHAPSPVSLSTLVLLFAIYHSFRFHSLPVFTRSYCWSWMYNPTCNQISLIWLHKGEVVARFYNKVLEYAHNNQRHWFCFS